MLRSRLWHGVAARGEREPTEFAAPLCLIAIKLTQFERNVRVKLAREPYARIIDRCAHGSLAELSILRPGEPGRHFRPGAEKDNVKGGLGISRKPLYDDGRQSPSLPHRWGREAWGVAKSAGPMRAIGAAKRVVRRWEGVHDTGVFRLPSTYVRCASRR